VTPVGAGLTASLVERLHEHAFAPGATGVPRRIGAEIEWIPVDRASGAVVPIATSIETLRRLAREAIGGPWRECPSASGAPTWRLADGSMVSFEPGGQLECSSAPSDSASVVAARLVAVGARIDAALGASADARLLAVGLDPINPLAAVPMQLGGPRYRAMAAYFDTIGPAGARMMRQTASVQVSLDRGADPTMEWRLLNGLAPYLVAIFANSPRSAGAPSGHVSARAATWRAVDPRRTGIFEARDVPAAEYAAFALAAPAILEPSYPVFADLVARADRPAGDLLAAWDAHLTTLFPEVRPRGTFEVRSADAIPLPWLVVPLALIGGLLYDPAAAREAAAVVGDPDAALLERAGTLGLHDARLAEGARDLAVLAVEGCRRLGPAFLDGPDLDRVVDFVDRYTRRARAPADDTP